MRLYKRGTVWWARWTERGETVRKSTKQNDREAARRTVLRWQRELADPRHKTEGETTFGTAADRFLSEIEDTEKLSAGTINMYDCKTNHLVRLFDDGRLPLSAITHERVRTYIAQRRKETAVDYTIHRELTALRRVLKSAQRAGEFQRDPKSVIPKFSTGYEPRRDYLTPEQLSALMAHLDPARAAQVAFVVATSARLGEVQRARRSDLRTDRVHLRGTKTAASRREVPIVSMFADLYSFAQKHADGAGDKLFSPWTNMYRDTEAAAVRASTDDIKVPAATWNDLRRTCATWLVQAGVATNLVARILGHTTSIMVDRVYGIQTADSIGHLIERTLKAPK